MRDEPIWSRTNKSLVSQHDFDAAQTILKQRRTRFTQRKSKLSEFLFTGFFGASAKRKSTTIETTIAGTPGIAAACRSSTTTKLRTRAPEVDRDGWTQRLLYLNTPNQLERAANQSLKVNTVVDFEGERNRLEAARTVLDRKLKNINLTPEDGYDPQTSKRRKEVISGNRHESGATGRSEELPAHHKTQHTAAQAIRHRFKNHRACQ